MTTDARCRMHDGRCRPPSPVWTKGDGVLTSGNRDLGSGIRRQEEGAQ
jgi:hypothetical protein